MKSAIVLSNNEKCLPMFREILAEITIDDVSYEASASSIRKQENENLYDLYVVNTPLSDESGIELAIEIARKRVGEVILLVKADAIDKVTKIVDEFGIIVIAKPISKSIIINAVKMAQSSFHRMQLMKDENAKLLQELEDMKVINRAKCLLISCLRMTEKEAHKYIERQAMDMRITKKSVAEGVLKTYDN